MAARVTDDMVRDWLIWARNYGEIEQYEMLPLSGRKWKITVRSGVHRSNGHGSLAHISSLFADKQEDFVPTEMVLTNREALVFGMGCAAAGANKQTRSNYAHEEWGG